MPSNNLSALQILTNITLMTLDEMSYYYYPHITEKKTEAQGG